MSVRCVHIAKKIFLFFLLHKLHEHIYPFAAPHGVVFELAPDAVGEGLFAAFTGSSGKVRFNLGPEARFRHAPPAADFQAYAEFEAQTSPN
jgi:hypothetical protein